MEINGDHDDLLYNPSKTETFNLSNLVSIISYQLTAYIGSATTKAVVDWLENGLPVDLEPQMRAAFDVAAPIAQVESELKAQGFLYEEQEDIGSYSRPVQMLREVDVENARSILMQVAAAEYLSNEAADLDAIEIRLQDWIKHAELPENVDYQSQLWQGRLSLTLVHTGFPIEKHRRWNRGIDWPCWDQIIAAVPEMARARREGDLTTGFPLRYLRSKFRWPTSEE